jgi:hypothetical protein
LGLVDTDGCEDSLDIWGDHRNMTGGWYLNGTKDIASGRCNLRHLRDGGLGGHKAWWFNGWNSNHWDTDGLWDEGFDHIGDRLNRFGTWYSNGSWHVD